MTTGNNDTAPRALPAEVVELTRARLAVLCGAATQAELLVNQLMNQPLVQAAVARRVSAAAARAQLADSSRAAAAAAIDAAATELLSLPSEAWCARLAGLTRRQQKATLQRLVANAGALARSQPDRADQLAASILNAVRGGRLPRHAPLVRRQLAGRALLVRARSLMTLRAYNDALPVIADAYAAFPRRETYDPHRMEAQLLRAQALAAIGEAADALQALIACAQFAVENLDPSALVDALASTAVLLCAHREYAAAQPAIALATRVAGQAGNERSLAALQASLAECAFLGYTAGHV